MAPKTSMRLTRHCALVLAALLLAGPGSAHDPPDREPTSSSRSIDEPRDGEPTAPVRHAIETFVVDLSPYEQPCTDLPVFQHRPPAEVLSWGDFENLSIFANVHRQKLEEEQKLGEAVDEAHFKMVINTVNHLRHMITQQDVETTVWAYGQVAWWTMSWYYAMDRQFEFAEQRRRWVKTEYYDRLIPIFPTLDEAQQIETLEAFEKRMGCLQLKRRAAFVAIQHHRKQYADHLRALQNEQRGLTAGLGVTEDAHTGEIEVTPTERARQEAARVAAAAIGEANAMRAYLWLVPETSLHISVYSRLLRQRESFLYNTRLHELELDAVRADTGLLPHDALPPSPSRIPTQEEIFELRARRALLHLYLEDMQLEAGFKRSTSIRQSTSELFTQALENGRRVYQGIVQNPELLESDKATGFEATTMLLGSFAIAFRLAGDTLNLLAVQPLVDSFKDTVKSPLLALTGIEVQNSIEKAYDDYWKARDRLDQRIKVLRRLEPSQGAAFVEWARTRTEPTETATGLPGASSEAVASILEDASFAEATDGGLVHIFAALVDNPADLAALYTTGAYFELRGNAKAGAARIAVSRAISDVGTAGGELGPEVVERIIDPMGQSLVNAVNADSWFFANWMYLGWQTAKVVAFDLIWNLPTRVKLLVAYHRTGAAYEQDDYLRAIEKRQGEINQLRRYLAETGFDYDRLERQSPIGYALHVALCETSHEYAGAFRRIRAAHWEREKRWIWARFRDENSRARGEPERLSAVGTWAAARAKTREDMEISRLAFREGVLRARYLAYTMAYDAAATQLRQLQPVAETYYTAHSRAEDAAAVATQFAEQIKRMEAEAVRGELVGVYEGLFKTMLVETAVSMVSTRLLNSVVGRAQRAGLMGAAPAAAGGWSQVGARLRQTLNPWAGKFGWEGIQSLVKDAALQGFRETAAKIATDNWFNKEYVGVSEQAVDEMLDFLLSVADQSVENMGDVLARSDVDRQADTELYQARYEATKQVDEALAEVETRRQNAVSDDERARLEEQSLQLRAKRALITGQAEDPEVFDAARSHLAAITGELTRDRLKDDAQGIVLGDDGSLDLESVNRDVYATLVAGMRDRIHSPAVTAGDIRRLVDPGDYLKLNDRILRGNGFDIQSLRHALTRAADNDPRRSVELLAYAIALDQRRAEVVERVFDQLAEDPRFYGKLAVLRDTNRVAMIGDDPQHRSRLDTPGIFVDQEFDVVIQDGADISEAELRNAIDTLFMRQGFPPPIKEGERSSIGVRTHIQSESAILERGRKSGRRALEAEEYLSATARRSGGDDESRFTTRFDGPHKPMSEMSEAELAGLARPEDVGDVASWKRRMATERGIDGDHAWRLHLMAQLYDAVIVVRNGNTDSLEYFGKPGYVAKEMSCKAKTARVGDYLGLVVNPRHDTQRKAWDKAIADAPSEAEKNKLRYHRKRAEEAWDTYGAKMLASGNYIEHPDGVIGRLMPDGTFSKGIHGDYDLHEVFVRNPETGRWVRVSFGDGSTEDNQARASFRSSFNADLGASVQMFLHGGQGDWDHPGKTADPPVTIFAPTWAFEETGVRSGDGASSSDELRNIFENKLNTGWAYADGHSDLIQGIYRDRLFASIGGQRLMANRTIPGTETPDEGPFKGVPLPVRGWVPIPMWQAYGIAVDLLPQIGFLADPAYEAETVTSLPNTADRCRRLDGALRQVDGFLQLVDAWLISQPAGNVEYNRNRSRRVLEAAPDWRRRIAGDDARVRADQPAELRPVAERLRTDPAAAAGGHRRNTLLDVAAVDRGGASSLFAGEDLETLKRLVAAAEMADRADPFETIGGRTPAGVDQALALIDWMRVASAAMYAEIGSSFWSEYQRMTLDGAEVEDGYARDEAYRISRLIDRARVAYPDLVIAFLQPPVLPADGHLVSREPSGLRAAILTDMHTVLTDRKAAAAARRAASQTVRGDGAVAAFTSAAATDDDPRIFAWIETWLALSGRS